MLVKVRRLALVVAALSCARSRPRPRRCAPTEARHFIAGKHFAYSCFDGTTGNGRIYADGSVAGYIQPGGTGPRRYVVLPTGTLRTQRRPLLRLAARPPVRALLQPRPHQPGELPRLDLGLWLCLLQFHPARLARRICSRRRPTGCAASAPRPARTDRQTILRFSAPRSCAFRLAKARA